MRALLLILCSGFVLACDDEYVREHIIDNFVCTYMPNWMGDCQGTETTTKVMSVLDHGILEASADCEVEVDIPCQDTDIVFHFRADLLFDGSSIVTCDGNNGSFTAVNHRGEPVIATKRAKYGSDSGKFECEASAGELEIRYDGEWCALSSPSFGAFDMGLVCAGHNLEAFGVE